MKNKKISTISLIGYLSFLLSIGILTAGAFLTYEIVTSKTNKTIIVVVVLLLYVLFVTLITSIIDYIRRRDFIDKPVLNILDASDNIINGNYDVKLKINHRIDKYNAFDYISENINLLASVLKNNEMMHNDFISNVSHEIKTPLSIIQSYVKLLDNNDLDETTRQYYVKTIVAASSRLNNLVTNMLKLNKLENQGIIPTLESVNLYDSLSEAIFGFISLIESKEINLTCNLDEIVINSIPDYLDMIWNNLISNAIKFTEKKGNITISLYKEDKYAVITVSDDGCGISKEVGEHIFDKFYQGDTSHQQEGNGLGLALVKKIIDLMGGEIYVESTLGEGSKFIVKLIDQVCEV